MKSLRVFLIGILMSASVSISALAQERLPSLVAEPEPINWYLTAFAGASLNSLSSEIFENWDNGYKFGFGAGYQRSEFSDLSFHLSYHTYPYKGGSLLIFLPDSSPVNISTRGESSTVLEGSAGGRLMTSGERFVPYVGVRAGFYSIQTGRVTVTERSMSTDEIVNVYTLANTDETNLRGFIGLEIGMQAPINDRLSMNFETGITKAFGAAIGFIPFIGMIEYSF
ncbi:MAG: outer membrane beta-barrel protein [Balneolales bacterium]|nr:outer membrane beta-barrel protein [Balneolales bacterium]